MKTELNFVEYRPTGARFDAITYAILKEDWQTGTTTPVNWHDE